MDKEEVFELIVSWITLSVAFAWNLNPVTFFYSLPFYLLAVGTAFVFHELAHRFVANRLGYPARFVMWKEGLIFAVLLAILTNGRFVFAAPGAVYIFGHPRERDNAYISLAGPLTNLLLAYLFFFLALLFSYPRSLFLILLSLAKVNAFIGFFNMMPIFPLDGAKVLPWNPFVYFLVLLAFAPFFIF